eukprot:9473112-Pyramimonas_sp.AAC.1
MSVALTLKLGGPAFKDVAHCGVAQRLAGHYPIFKHMPDPGPKMGPGITRAGRLVTVPHASEGPLAVGEGLKLAFGKLSQHVVCVVSPNSGLLQRSHLSWHWPKGSREK